MAFNKDHQILTKEVQSHVRFISTEYCLLCECIRRLYVVLLRSDFQLT